MKQKLLLKVMLLLCALVAGSSSSWADVSTLTFTSTCGGTGTADDGAEWTVTSDGTESTYDSTKGIHYGTGSAEVTYIQLSTSDISGTISKIVVNASTASGVSATVSVTVDGSAFGGDAQSLTSSAANYTFTGSASGDIVVTVTKPSKAAKAIYVKSIAVTYTTSGGGGSDPSITANNVNITQDATNGSIAYTLNNATGNVTATVTTGDWLTLGTVTESTVPFTCSANTGAQRTAQVTLSFTGATDKVVTITQAPKTVDAPTFNLEGNKRYWQGTEVTLTSEGNTIYYNMTTDGSAPSTPTNASTEYTAPIALGSGTIKITAIAYDTYGNSSSTTTRTYTGVAPATLPFSWDEKSTTTTGIICSTGVGTYNNSPYLKIDATDQNVILKFDGVPGTLTFDIKGNSFSGGTFKVQTSADGENYSDLKAYTELGDKTTESFILANTVRYIKWIYTEKSSGNVALGNINLTSTITLTPAKTYTTLTSAKDLDFTGLAGLEAYIVKDNDASDGYVTLTQVNKVPANTGLVLVKTSGTTFNVPVFDGTGADNVDGNLMAGSATATTAIAANGGYILSEGAFHPANAGNLPAGKAYLAIPASAPVLNLDFGGTTGINAVNGSEFKVNGEYYNLAGQRVANPTKGLYIVNGKKVIIK